MRLSIRAKLILTFLAALVIAAATLAGVIFTILLVVEARTESGSISMLEATRMLSAHSNRVEEALEAGAGPEELRNVALPEKLPGDVRIRIIDNQARVWLDTHAESGRIASGAEIMEWVGTFADHENGVVTMPERLTVKGENWGYYAVTFASGYPSTLTLNDGSKESQRVAVIFLGGVGLALLVNVALFWAFGWHIVKPLRHLSDVVSRIAAGDLSARSRLQKRRDELGQFAKDLDTMATRLEEARNQAASAEKSRRYLVAAASHDLRTPLTALLAHAEAIRTGVTEDPAASVGVIEEKGLLLKRLIDDLFELAALDAAQERWQTVRTDVGELLRRSVVGALPELEAAGMEVEPEIPEEPLWANLAPGKLERVIDNLLVNARKYGADGGWIGVRAARQGDRIRVEVANRGPAIPAETANEIFERFYRADTARTSKVGGSGLGLAIAREIVARHGGTIGVVSPAEGGAVFWFEVPAI